MKSMTTQVSNGSKPRTVTTTQRCKCENGKCQTDISPEPQLRNEKHENNENEKHENNENETHENHENEKRENQKHENKSVKRT